MKTNRRNFLKSLGIGSGITIAGPFVGAGMRSRENKERPGHGFIDPEIMAHVILSGAPYNYNDIGKTIPGISFKVWPNYTGNSQYKGSNRGLFKE